MILDFFLVVVMVMLEPSDFIQQHTAQHLGIYQPNASGSQEQTHRCLGCRRCEPIIRNLQRAAQAFAHIEPLHKSALAGGEAARTVESINTAVGSTIELPGFHPTNLCRSPVIRVEACDIRLVISVLPVLNIRAFLALHTSVRHKRWLVPKQFGYGAFAYGCRSCARAALDIEISLVPSPRAQISVAPSPNRPRINSAGQSPKASTLVAYGDQAPGGVAPRPGNPVVEASIVGPRIRAPCR